MSAKAGIYSNKNFGFRPKSRPVVAFGVKFKIFNLFGGAGGRVPLGGVFCLRGYAAQRRAAPCKNNRAAIVPKLVARVPRAFIGGTDLILPPRLFWNLFWSQKSSAPPQMPFSRRPNAISPSFLLSYAPPVNFSTGFCVNLAVFREKSLCYNTV